ncbi:MAG TPA: chemotaxis protein CheB [Trebonia sp.]|jgi:two-component system chemotaxis response regulator CheB|nr:chemotaxis protein CheB [Trebonia sp.]
MASGRDVVVVAASAGGLQPLCAMLSQLPAGLPAAVLVVMHVPATGGSSLPRILDRAGPLPAAAAVNGERLRLGRVYVAPPDKHMLVVKDTVRLSRGPRQNGVRPAADPLFRSAALHAGPRVIGVVLSGTMDDAALGSATVERRGGRVIVQDPDDADYDSMPCSAFSATEHAEIVPTWRLAKQLIRLVMEEVDMPLADTSDPDEELVSEIGGLLTGTLKTNTESRTHSEFTCPECGGPLYRATEEHAETYDCLVGHRWAPETLFEEQSAALERALWLAIRSLEERGRLTTRLAEAARGRGHAASAEQFAQAAAEAQDSADAIRSVASGMTAEVAAKSQQA